MIIAELQSYNSYVILHLTVILQVFCLQERISVVDKKLLFIVNPRAGKTKSRAPLFDAVSVFSDAGYLVRVAQTQRQGDATTLAAQLGAD